MRASREGTMQFTEEQRALSGQQTSPYGYQPRPVPPTAQPQIATPTFGSPVPPAIPPMPPAIPAPARRTWPQLLLTGFGGLMAGMLLMVLIFAVTGSARAVPGSSGSQAAAWDLSYVITDDYLTAQAKAGSSLIQDPHMNVGADGKITLSGKVSVIGPAVPLRATLQPTIVDGNLRLSVVSAQLVGLPLPGFIERQIEDTIARAQQLPKLAVPVTLVRIETKEGQLILYNKVK
jgi:hypothetical protein